MYLYDELNKGLHFLTVVTVNDYLAQRDAEWMGSIHRFLGLSVGLIQVFFLPVNAGCFPCYSYH